VDKQEGILSNMPSIIRHLCLPADAFSQAGVIHHPSSLRPASSTFAKATVDKCVLRLSNASCPLPQKSRPRREISEPPGTQVRATYPLSREIQARNHAAKCA